MNKSKNFLTKLALVIPAFVLAGAFVVLGWVSKLYEKVKERYYILCRIPYYKVQSKFHPYVVRKNR